MNHFNLTPKRAASYEEIQPLLSLCKAGRLFDVQKWIASGRPIIPPLGLKIRKKSPLELAIELGFHSLVEVLLEGGALVEDQRYSPLSHALEKRRLDLILLLVKYGADPKSVSMDQVVATGDRKLIDYFMIHLLARHGAKWHPMDKADFNQVRSSLRKMKPEYILEFIWIMAGYRSCSREAIMQLIGTPIIRKQILNDIGVVNRLIAQLD